MTAKSGRKKAETTERERLEKQKSDTGDTLPFHRKW